MKLEILLLLLAGKNATIGPPVGIEPAALRFRCSNQPSYRQTDISQHTPYRGFSVTGYIMNR